MWFLDGSVNVMFICVVNWIFVEEFVKRDGFVEEFDIEEELTAATEEEEEIIEASSSSEVFEVVLEELLIGCFVCFGVGRDKKIVLVLSELESVEEEM